jgi:lipid A 3-O-deacylase
MNMDGRLAVLFFVVGLTDMTMNDCKRGGCLERSPEQSAVALSFGDVIFQEKVVGQETYARYDFGTSIGPFQPALGVSVTDSRDIWVGLGATHTTRFWERSSGAGGYAQLSFMPGLWSQGTGPDLGHPVEFRSGAEIGWQIRNGVKVGISYDHRSNGDMVRLNPGLETLTLRVHVPLN